MNQSKVKLIIAIFVVCCIWFSAFCTNYVLSFIADSIPGLFILSLPFTIMSMYFTYIVLKEIKYYQLK